MTLAVCLIYYAIEDLLLIVIWRLLRFEICAGVKVPNDGS